MSLLNLFGFKKVRSRQEVVQHYLQVGLSEWGAQYTPPSGWRWHPYPRNGHREFALVRERGAPQTVTRDELALIALEQLNKSLGDTHAPD